MESFIDIRGQAPLIETVVEHRADLTVTVRATQAETAMAEVEDLRKQCIHGLREGGLKDSELNEGGGEIWRPWFWRKKVGQEVSRKILITCEDVNRLYRALASLEHIFANQRYTLAVSMRQPKFEATAEARAAARIAAIDDAREKAEVLAGAADVALGPIIQIEEIHDQVGSSGVYGDNEWWAAAGGAVAAAAGPGEEETETLEAATRTRTVRFRVRFSLEGGMKRMGFAR